MPRIITTGINRNGFVLPDGHSWDASLINGKKEGKVTVRDGNGIVSHVLHFANDQLNGVSKYYRDGKLVEILVWKNNIVLKRIVDNKMTEYSYTSIEENMVYEGGYLNASASGYPREGMGKEYDDGMLVYSGQWKNNKREGEGKEYDGGELVYDGEWKNGKSEGIGKEYNDGKVVYSGQWKNGIREGRGKGYNDGEVVYSGQWKNDKREGRGKGYNDGELVYDGEWENDKREGEGKGYHDGELVYDGEWKNDKREGEGKGYYDGELVYDGEWKNGKREGRGKEYEDGEVVYNGEWKDGKRKGKEYHDSSDDESVKKGRKGAGLAAAAVTTGATGTLTSAGGALASLVGFGSPGVAAGSWAASLMSASATSGIGAGVISALQSAGALFVNAFGASTLVATGAVALPVVAGVAAYKIITKSKGKNSKRKRR